jgi:hypothetical protein
MPAMSDSARKRTLADWVVKNKKQAVKLYAIAKWARDADAVQKAMVRLLLAATCAAAGLTLDCRTSPSSSCSSHGSLRTRFESMEKRKTSLVLHGKGDHPDVA